MNMSEYLQKKNQENQKTTQDRMKELQDAERRAKEIRESLKAEKRKEFGEKVHNFHIFGMGFRPWTLNDMVILLVIAIIVVGGLSFIPGKEVSSDTSNNEGGFFTKLFGGFAVKDVKEETTQETTENTEEVAQENTNPSETELAQTEDQTTNEETNAETADLADFSFEVKYKDQPFATINSTGNELWYTLSIKNSEVYNIKCNVDHYVNDKLKSDQSTVTVEAEKSADIMMREMSTDAVETLVRVKIVVNCWDGANENTKNEKLQRLKFYFS